jgi:hypothetical protein
MKRVDLAVAAAAGLSAVFPLYQIFTLADICESPTLTPVEALALLAALASYLSVPSLLRRLRGQRVARFVWLWTPLLGSLLSAVAIYCFLRRNVDWGFKQSAFVWLALSLWTLPFAAAAYYSGTFVRRIRRRHEGTKEDMSISGR